MRYLRFSQLCFKDSGLQWYDAESFGEWFPTFRWKVVPPSSRVVDCLTLEDEDTTFLQNVRNHSPKYTESYPRRLESNCLMYKVGGTKSGRHCSGHCPLSAIYFVTSRFEGTLPFPIYLGKHPTETFGSLIGHEFFNYLKMWKVIVFISHNKKAYLQYLQYNLIKWIF
jgi:hypothetical protein